MGDVGPELDNTERNTRHGVRVKGVQSEVGADRLYRRTAHATPPSPDELLERLRRLRLSEVQKFVVAHFFVGPQQEGYVEAQMVDLAKSEDPPVYFVAVDLIRSHLPNFVDPLVFHIFMTVIDDGCVDIILNRPHCSTWSRWRGLLHGPRPMCFR